MWSLFENNQELKPLIFSNGKSQEDIVKEVIDAVKSGYKIIFIKGMCGTGKSAIALNIAKELGRASIIVPVKALQEQYRKDYTEKKYVLRNNEKLKISCIVGRKNFKCKFLEEQETIDLEKYSKEKNASLFDIHLQKKQKPSEDKSCDNIFLPCKIELKEKNLPTIKDYVKKNLLVNTTNFSKVSDVKRMTIAPICDYWSPILPSELEFNSLKDAKKLFYLGLKDKQFTIYQRKLGCGFYDQHIAYTDSDVIIFNAMKYKLETIMDRKPATDIEIIDEGDDFLDSFANKENINLNRLLFAFSNLFPEDSDSEKIINDLINIIKNLQSEKNAIENTGEIFPIQGTNLETLLVKILKNQSFLSNLEIDESNYLYHLDEVAKTFEYFLDETFFSFEKREKEVIVHLVTTNLAKKFKELAEKNKILILMSGTLHTNSVLNNIFGINDFITIDAETNPQGELIKCRYGYEFDCKYANFKSNKVSREEYLKALSKSIAIAKPPVLVQVTAFSDLPKDYEKITLKLDNLPTQTELINQQINDPLGKRIEDFKLGKIKKLFTTKCNRGADFPGETCNSIVITRFPYPNIYSIFWKILKQNKPEHFMSFYMDKARRDLLQKIYRGLRSKNDKIYLLSPDIRVLDFNIN